MCVYVCVCVERRHRQAMVRSQLVAIILFGVHGGRKGGFTVRPIHVTISSVHNDLSCKNSGTLSSIFEVVLYSLICCTQ